jgi:putative membrane protein
MNLFLRWIVVYLKGVAMGASDVIPGVSGGTIAFITGIYERLIQAIKSIGWANLKLLFTGRLNLFWKNIDGTFLVAVVFGMGTSLFTLAHLMTYLLDEHAIMTWSFFFGLILASTYFVGKGVKWDWRTFIAFVLFTVISFIITSPENTPLETAGSSVAYWYLFLCGAIAICAMILPGISGSFILVLLGQYYFLMTAVQKLDVVILGVFAAGALIGIVAFSNVLSWLFKHFRMITLASLTGFMLGSLNKIWPWKYIANPPAIIEKGKIYPAENVSPAEFEKLTGNMNMLVYAILFLVIGFALIFIIEFISLKSKKKPVETEQEHDS